MDKFANKPDYHGDVETSLNGLLIGLSTFLFGLRIFVRTSMTKSPGLDDGIAAIAYLLLVTQSTMDIHAVSFGSGVHLAVLPEDLLFKFYKSLGVQTLIYFWAVAMVRLAILAFLPRLARDKSTIWVSWTIAAIILAQTITAFVYRLAECIPVPDSFKPPGTLGLHCVGHDADSKMMLGHGIVGILIDVILLFLPIWVICTRMMWSKKKIQIILVLSVGVFAVATGIIRVVLMTTLDFSTDVTFKMPFLGIWTNLEGHIGFWCCCFPALQPILRLMPCRLRRLTMLDSNDNLTRHGCVRENSHNETKREHRRSGESSEIDSENRRGVVSLEMEEGTPSFARS
ncbi:hypothetical protein GGR54DRAFT_513407 [Hypoxylon sp. NC1633]|nr:hypothetical protein GGR54DRAFT_513407 [Hypoxylon sp. NC1633]